MRRLERAAALSLATEVLPRAALDAAYGFKQASIMNKFAIISAVLLSIGVAIAQTQPKQQPPAAPAAAQSAAPQTNAPPQPAQQTSPGTQSGPTPAAPARHAPQAKSQEEFTAYQQVVQQQDPDAAAKAADEFAVKYPQSELRAPLYQEMTRRFFSANKADQVVLYGHKTLELEPNNPLALAMIARVLAERTQENDIDHDERLNEAVKDANQMIGSIDQTLPDIVPPNLSPDQTETVKKQLLFMAWDAEGKADMELKQDAKAQQAFEKALQYAPDEGRTRFRLALALDRQGKYQDALTAVNQALQNTGQDPTLAQQAQQEKSRLQQLTGAGGTPPAGAPPNSSPAKPPRR
jgi:tetratricopeptide (TPR) repeat protein